MDAAAGVWVYTDNTDFLRDNVRSQDPLWALELHAGYNFRPGLWLAADATYYTGGETSLNGAGQRDLLANSRYGLTLSVPLAPGFLREAGLVHRTVHPDRRKLRHGRSDFSIPVVRPLTGGHATEWTQSSDCLAAHRMIQLTMPRRRRHSRWINLWLPLNGPKSFKHCPRQLIENEKPSWNSAFVPSPAGSKGFHDCRGADSSPRCPEMGSPVVADEPCIFNKIGEVLRCPER